ncbi:hypothetical protein Msip34_1646 [Methylovorus glucosotrophus SIP3-4]|uniref:Uncharacterized protein n=1 Tax=Methylovorus glucosotrophus (strain SIP3-4) TaxID=582744 RepID=C6XEB6_METGS|nr:hypothetical protein Msip34_1646 [Methylovorus glucosotrophus SIP3-4]
MSTFQLAQRFDFGSTCIFSAYQKRLKFKFQFKKFFETSIGPGFIDFPLETTTSFLKFSNRNGQKHDVSNNSWVGNLDYVDVFHLLKCGVQITPINICMQPSFTFVGCGVSKSQECIYLNDQSKDGLNFNFLVVIDAANFHFKRIIFLPIGHINRDSHSNQAPNCLKPTGKRWMCFNPKQKTVHGFPFLIFTPDSQDCNAMSVREVFA